MCRTGGRHKLICFFVNETALAGKDIVGLAPVKQNFSYIRVNNKKSIKRLDLYGVYSAVQAACAFTGGNDVPKGQVFGEQEGEPFFVWGKGVAWG